MTADLDTLLTALYVELTDRIIPLRGPGRRGPGRPPDVTDAELACLAVAQDSGPASSSGSLPSTPSPGTTDRSAPPSNDP